MSHIQTPVRRQGSGKMILAAGGRVPGWWFWVLSLGFRVHGCSLLDHSRFEIPDFRPDRFQIPDFRQIPEPRFQRPDSVSGFKIPEVQISDASITEPRTLNPERRTTNSEPGTTNSELRTPNPDPRFGNLRTNHFSLTYSRSIAVILSTRRRWRSSVKSVPNQARTISRIRSFEIIFPPSVSTLAPLCSRLFRADASS